MTRRTPAPRQSRRLFRANGCRVVQGKAFICAVEMGAPEWAARIAAALNGVPAVRA